jgi:hypothetical protein
VHVRKCETCIPQVRMCGTTAWCRLAFRRTIRTRTTQKYYQIQIIGDRGRRVGRTWTAITLSVKAKSSFLSLYPSSFCHFFVKNLTTSARPLQKMSRFLQRVSGWTMSKGVSVSIKVISVKGTYRVRERHLLWVPSIPEVLCSLDLLDGSLTSERRSDTRHNGDDYNDDREWE